MENQDKLDLILKQQADILERIKAIEQPEITFQEPLIWDYIIGKTPFYITPNGIVAGKPLE
jgi:hypothetical protein